MPGPTPSIPTIRQIQEVVAKRYGVSIDALTSEKRDPEVGRPRRIAFWLAKSLTPLSLQGIGRQFGNRDHHSVLRAVRWVNDLKAREPQLEIELLALTNIIRKSESNSAREASGSRDVYSPPSEEVEGEYVPTSIEIPSSPYDGELAALKVQQDLAIAAIAERHVVPRAEVAARFGLLSVMDAEELSRIGLISPQDLPESLRARSYQRREPISAHAYAAAKRIVNAYNKRRQKVTFSEDELDVVRRARNLSVAYERQQRKRRSGHAEPAPEA